MKSVLIVDDSNAIRSLIRSVIEDIGDINVFEAATGFEALKTLPQHKLDLILVDINMPDINGLELTNFIKTSNQYRHIPVIIITTEASDEDKKKGLGLGAKAYVTKPFKYDELQELIRGSLGL
ncbi:MAG: response regulator [Thermodesulfovibrionia bacterium]